MNIQDTVNESLDNAKDSGFFEPGMALYGCDAFAIAQDLVTYDASFEGFEPSQLIKSVENWLLANSVLIASEYLEKTSNGSSFF